MPPQANALADSWARVEERVTGQLAPAVRHNMRVELLYALVFGLFNTAMQFVPVILRHMGGSAEVLAFYGAASYFALVLTGPVLLLLRRFRILRVLVVCWILSRGLLATLGLVDDVTWFLIITTVYWLFDSVPSPIYARIIQTIYPARQRGKVMSLVKLGLAGSMLIATPFVGILLDHAGYKVLFPLAALSGVGAALIFSRIKVNEQQAAVKPAQSLGFVWRIPLSDRRYGIYLLGMSFFGLGGLIGNSFYPFVMVDQMRLSYSDIGWLGLVQSAFWLLSYFYWGRQIDRQGAMRVMQFCAALNAVQPLVYMFAQNGWELIPAFVALGLVSAGTDIGFVNTYIQLADPTRVPEYAAIHATVMGVRGIVGLYLGVLLHNWGMSFTMIFALGVFFNIVAFALWTWVYQQTRKKVLSTEF